MSAPWLRNNTASSPQGAVSNGKAASVWSEHVANDNRVYYWNSETKTSSWEKPDVLKTAEERVSGVATSQTNSAANEAEDWKEYETADGKKYYHNHKTEFTTWDKPEALLQAEKAKRDAAEAARRSQAEQEYHNGGMDDEMHQELERTDRINVVGQDGKAISAAMYALSDEAVPTFKTTEQAEEAFHKMLRKNGVHADWSWDQIMRAAIKDPVWRALPNSTARKAAFEQYVIDVKKATIGKQKDRIEKLKRDFDLMLRRHDEIKSYSLWKNVKANLEGEVAYKAAIDDEEREALFEIYIEQLQVREVEEAKQRTSAAVKLFTKLLQDLKVDLETTWDEADQTTEQSDAYQSDPRFKDLEKIDSLLAFEDHIKELENKKAAQVRQERAMKFRQERKNRESFSALLQDLQVQGHIHAGVMWKQIYPLIKDRPEFTSMLGQPGSSPMDLFFDAVDELNEEFKIKKSMVQDVLAGKNARITVDQNFATFRAVMDSDNRTSHMSESILTAIFKQLQEKAQKRADEERKAEERRIRRKQDDLRSAMKKLDPPIGINDSYEAVRARLSMLAEFTVLEAEADRQAAYEKYIRRLKERIEEEEERAHRRDRHSRRQTSPRDRRHDRERRSSRESRRSGGDDREAETRRRQRGDRPDPTGLDPRSPKRARKDDFGTNDDTKTSPLDSAMYDENQGQIVHPEVKDNHSHTNGTTPAPVKLKKNEGEDDSSEEGEIAE